MALRLALAILGLSLSGCGYQPVYTAAARLGGDASQGVHVRVVRSLIADAVASDEVAAGAREELAFAGRLDRGDGFPRIEIEVLRSDVASAGVAAAGGLPTARASEIGLVARAWLATSAGAAPRADTGDLRAEESSAIDAPAGVLDPRGAAFHDTDALRAAARRLGRRLAQKILGLPAATGL